MSVHLSDARGQCGSWQITIKHSFRTDDNAWNQLITTVSERLSCHWQLVMGRCTYSTRCRRRRRQQRSRDVYWPGSGRTPPPRPGPTWRVRRWTAATGQRVTRSARWNRVRAAVVQRRTQRRATDARCKVTPPRNNRAVLPLDGCDAERWELRSSADDEARLVSNIQHRKAFQVLCYVL